MGPCVKGTSGSQRGWQGGYGELGDWKKVPLCASDTWSTSELGAGIAENPRGRDEGGRKCMSLPGCGSDWAVTRSHSEKAPVSVNRMGFVSWRGCEPNH